MTARLPAVGACRRPGESSSRLVSAVRGHLVKYCRDAMPCKLDLNRLRSRTLAAAASLLAAGIVLAEPAPSWSRTTDRGTPISIDPTTNKAVIARPDGVVRPLWDGVHRLDDGTTLTVRAGVVVEDPDMSASRREPPPLVQDPGTVSPCVTLTRRVCGINRECGSAAGCELASQLLKFEQDERTERPGATPTTILYQCREALTNPATFPACPSNVVIAEDGPCRALIRRVCGVTDGCRDTRACRAAQQLAEMELQERLRSMEPEADPPAATQCTQALIENRFFAPCR